MLILTRYADEVVKIGDDISVKILDVKDKKVWIGFDAPIDMSIHREEIYNKLAQETMFSRGLCKNRLKNRELKALKNTLRATTYFNQHSYQ